MKITYDPPAKAVYIYLGDGHPSHTLQMTDDNGWTMISGHRAHPSNLSIDLDSAGNVVGIEILGVEQLPRVYLDPEAIVEGNLVELVHRADVDPEPRVRMACMSVPCPDFTEATLEVEATQ